MTLLASRGQLRASLLRWTLFLVPLVMVLGYISGVASGSTATTPWFAALEKPAIFPPPVVFGIVWPILYALMGFAAALVASAWGAKGRGLALVLFAVQLAVNLAWSPTFFAYHEMWGALVIIAVLDVLVLATLVMFWRVRWLAGALLLPYLAWICFATVLNWQFVELNPQADGAEVSGAVQRVEI